MGKKFAHKAEVNVEPGNREIAISCSLFGKVEEDKDDGSPSIVDKDGEELDFDSIFDQVAVARFMNSVEDIPVGSVIKLKGTLHAEIEVVSSLERQSLKGMTCKTIVKSGRIVCQ